MSNSLTKTGIVLTIASVALVLGTLPAFAQTTLSCSPARQTVNVNQQVTLTATGGNGSYSWATASGVWPNSGSSFSLTPTSPEITTVIVSSAGQTAVCVLDVVGANGYRVPSFESTGVGSAGGNVGVPNTGVGMNILVVAIAIVLGTFITGTILLFGRRTIASIVR